MKDEISSLHFTWVNNYNAGNNAAVFTDKLEEINDGVKAEDLRKNDVDRAQAVFIRI